jgi:glutathione S-transferase
VYELYIANKNYSSWSLRPWVLLRELAIPFVEHLLIFGDAAAWEPYRRLVPSGKVPALKDESTVVWDSFAIAEYLAERHAGVWPADFRARAWARSAAAEMHSGFSELRNRCGMNCGVRVRLHEMPASLANDITRLGTLWREGFDRFGGPFLAGATFTAVDAFFAPVAFRVQTYDLELHGIAAEYAARLLMRESMREWYSAGIRETARDLAHENEIKGYGTILEDLRATA